MKRFIGAILVSCSFLLAVHLTVAASPSQGIYSPIVYNLHCAEFTPSLRVEPQYGQPVTVYPVNTKLTEVPMDVTPSANSPPYTVSRSTYYR